MEKTIKEIYELQQMHKKALDVTIQQISIIIRDQLKDPMEQKTRKVFNKVAKDRYKWGNK